MKTAETEFGPLSVFSLTGKTAIVTGAASGVGKATASLFASVGARVVVADLNGPGAEAVAADIVAAGGKAIAVRCDISQETDVEATFAASKEAFGPVDVLVNNAAFRGKAEFMDVTVEQWDHMYNVIARGTFLCLRAAIKQMKAAGRGGSIVNISSVGALQTTLFSNIHYDGAKAAVDTMTRTAAVQFVADGIRVNSVLPGGVQSEGLSNIQKTVKWDGPVSMPGRLLSGFAQPVQLAHAILFLASPASSYVSGHCMVVDGGFLVS